MLIMDGLRSLSITPNRESDDVDFTVQDTSSATMKLSKKERIRVSNFFLKTGGFFKNGLTLMVTPASLRYVAVKIRHEDNEMDEQVVFLTKSQVKMVYNRLVS